VRVDEDDGDEELDEVDEQDEPLITENWVEYWNSPVPSTMINMP